MTARPAGRNADARTTRDIETHGWHVIKVTADPPRPPFAYSIGLTQRFGHPEVLVAGLDLDVLHQLVNTVGEAVREGRTFAAGQTYGEVLEGYDVAFRPVLRHHYAAYVGRALDHYGDAPFEVLQLFWPDAEGAFPWEARFPEEGRDRQPLLFQ